VKELCADLASEQDALDDLVAPLPATDWDIMTPAEVWSVRDQITHLTFFDEQATLAVTDPDRFAEAVNELGDDLASFEERYLTEGRAAEPAELLDRWRTSRRRLVAALEELDPDLRIPWFGPPLGARSFATARLMETWAHGQDVADALGVRREPTSRLRHIAHLGVITRPWSYLSRGRTPPDRPVRVELAAPDGDTWVWGEETDDVVRGPAEDFCLVVTQRRNVADTRLEVHGALAAEWMSIAQAFAGPPSDGRPAGMF
jgi:uncharacterized protein (TIGR03084 family)